MLTRPCLLLVLPALLAGCSVPDRSAPTASEGGTTLSLPGAVPSDPVPAMEPERDPPSTTDDGDTDPLALLEAEEEARAAALSVAPDADDWTERVLYFVLLDRFADGDPANLHLHGDAACNVPGDAHAFQGGDLAGLQSALSYVEALGPDALWLSPLYRGVPTKQGANCGFPGYWAEFADPYVLSLDPRYGDETLFDEVLEDAHGRGMKVMLDMVVNHAGYGAPLVAQHPEWFNDPATCGDRGQPDIDCPLAGLPDFNHDVPAAADYLEDLHRQWVDRFAIDGIRMDTVKHVTPGYFSRWNDAMREERQDLFIVGELLDEHSFDRFDPYLDAGFDGLFNFPLRQGLIATFARGESVDVVASRMQETLGRFGDAQTAQLVNLLDNHDVRRFTEEIPGFVDDDDARGRYLLAMTALLSLPGIPQIYYGNEVGMYGGHDPDNRRFLPSWVFNADLRQNSYPGFLAHPNVVFDTTQRLIALRRRMPALQRGTYRELWRQNDPANNNVWAFLRAIPHDDAPNAAAIVALNNGQLPTAGAVPLAVGDVFDDGEVLVDVLGPAGMPGLTVEDGRVWVSLPAQGAVVLQRASAPHPVDDVVSVSVSVRAHTYWGQSVFVTGSALGLGGWALDDAASLTPSQCDGSACTWSGSLTLPRSAAVDFKFVKIDDHLNVEWEAGFNRTLVADEGITVDATFR